MFNWERNFCTASSSRLGRESILGVIVKPTDFGVYALGICIMFCKMQMALEDIFSRYET